MIHFRVRYERLRGRLGQVRRRAALFRAAWLALLVPLVALLAHFGTGARLALVPSLAGMGLVFAVSAAWQFRRFAEQELGRALDRRYDLDDLMITAVEVDRRGARSVVEGRLLDDAATAVATLGDERAIDGRVARREGETTVALALIAAGLWLLVGTIGPPPSVQRLPPVPGFGVGAEGSGDEGGAGSGLGRGSGRGTGAGDNFGVSSALSALAGALGDHAGAGELVAALARGDPAAAASAARALADRAAGLSSAGREDLAALMHKAAAEVESLDPELAAAVQQAARALESPQPAVAAAGVERLATELDSLAVRPRAGPGAPDSAAHGRSAPQSRRLAVEPAPVPLAGGSGAPTDGSGPATGQGAARREERAARELRAGAATAGSEPVGPDPLRYPWVMRETVRHYFAPEARRP